MDIDGAENRHAQCRLRQDHAIRGDDQNVRTIACESGNGLQRFPACWLFNAQARCHGKGFDRRLTEFLSSPCSAVWLRINRDYLCPGASRQCAQRRQREGWRACEDNPNFARMRCQTHCFLRRILRVRPKPNVLNIISRRAAVLCRISCEYANVLMLTGDPQKVFRLNGPARAEYTQPLDHRQ